MVRLPIIWPPVHLFLFRREMFPAARAIDAFLLSHREKESCATLDLEASGNRQGGAMKWEYKMIQIPGRPEKDVDELNRLGSEGWEAVCAWADAMSTHVLLKRSREA